MRSSLIDQNGQFVGLLTQHVSSWITHGLFVKLSGLASCGLSVSAPRTSLPPTAQERSHFREAVHLAREQHVPSGVPGPPRTGY